MPRRECLLCIYCDPPVYHESASDLNQHLKYRHGGLTSFKCGHCQYAFRHKTSLIRHISNCLEESPSSDDSSLDDHNDHGNFDANDEENEDVHLNEDADRATTAGAAQVFAQVEPVGNAAGKQFDLETEAAIFLMNLRSSGNITGATVKIIQDYTKDLLNRVVSDLCLKVSVFLERNCNNVEDSEMFLKETFNVRDPFENLKSTDDQLQFLSDKFGLVIPEEKYLGSRVDHRLDRVSKMLLPTQVPETFQSISMIKTLTLIVKNKYLRQLILSEKSSDDGVLRSYKDGSDFKNNTFLQKYPDALRIELNHDDLETTNGMGSKDVIHKIGPLYFRIQNLPAAENSKLSSIFVLAVACSEDLKKKGAWSKILIPVREDLKKLMSDEGVEVDLPEGGTFCLRATIVCLCADCLAAHAIMGFMSPSAKKFCRFCLISMTELEENSTSIGALRTSALHKQHLEQVQNNPALKSTFGVESESSLSGMMRIPEDNVLDAFHDFVGVIHMVLKAVLYEYICVKKLFTVYQLNSNITSFVYGSPEVKNKPSANFTVDRLCSKGHGLKQSGAQTFCLLRIFPFIITGVEKTDRFLELVFLLQDVLKIVFSFELTPKDIQDLELLIHQHNSLFHELFVPPAQGPVLECDYNPEDDPDDDFSTQDENESEVPGTNSASSSGQRTRATKKLKKGINKLHHLLHYPKQMLEKGPLIRLWCARYEGRHLIFRRHSHVQCNFRNVPKTMAKMYQLSTLRDIVFRKEPETVISSASAPVLVKDSVYCDALLQRGLSEDAPVQIANSVNFHGEDYSSGLFVTLVSQDELRNSTPKFGLIFEIIFEVTTSKTFIVVNECVNEGLDGRFNSFKIRNLFDTPPQLVTIESLSHYRPMPAWSPVGGENSTSLYIHPRNVFC